MSVVILRPLKSDVWTDRFVDELGDSVDNTPVSGGKRTVDGVVVNRQEVDTESKLSQSGGELSISGGKAVPVYTDPALYWELTGGSDIDLLAGDVLLFSLRLVNPGASKYCRIGTSASIGGACQTPIIWFNTFTLYIIAPGNYAVDTYGAGDDVALLLIPRSETCGWFLYRWEETAGAWKLLYVDAVTVYRSTTFPAINDYNLPLAAVEVAQPKRIAALTDGDWTEVTDSKTAPGSGITFNCDANCHIKSTFTYETGKYIILSYRYLGGSNRWYVYIHSSGNLYLYKVEAGGHQSVSAVVGVFSDGVAYQVDLVANGDNHKVFVDGILKIDEDDDWLEDEAGGSVAHDFATNDIYLESHPHPAEGISVARIICPQLADTFVHGVYPRIEFRNVQLGASGSFDVFFRVIDASNYLYLSMVNDGSAVVGEMVAGAPASLVSVGAATLSSGDDVAVSVDRDHTVDFRINGTSQGTNTTNITSGIAGEIDAADGGAAADEIAVFDVYTNLVRAPKLSS